MTDINANLTRIQHQIKEYTDAHNVEAPQLIAVSKKQPIDSIIEAHQLGISHFGENYAQEFEEKVSSLQSLPITWHFIGPIQSNKAKTIAQYADWVHSVDRDKVAKKLNTHAEALNKTLNVLIQVNIDKEEQKAGIYPEAVAEFAEQLTSYSHLTLRGLMIIPQNSGNSAESFANCQQLFNTLRLDYPSMDTLSMGMSNDYLTAIEYGSTMVRIGSALLGERK